MQQKPALVFSLSEYRRRLDHLRSKMEQEGIELAVITDPENLTYLTGHQTSGYGSFQALFVPLQGDCFSCSRLIEESNFIVRTWVGRTFAYQDVEDPIQASLNSVKSMGISFGKGSKVGFEFHSFYLDRRLTELFRRTFPGLEIVSISGEIETARAVKSAEEIEIMKKAAIATEAAMMAAIDEVQVGRTENDIAAAAHEAMYRAGGEYPAVPPYIVCGERTNIGHATWEGRRIGNNECVFLELAGCYKRYHTAMMRTVVTGKAPPEMLEAEKIALEALETSMENMRPGASVGETARENQRIIASNKCGARQTGRSGYSIGIAFAPAWDEGHIVSLNPNSEMLWQENMTIHLIPFFFLPDIQMIMGISETVQITKTGAKSFFSKPERKLIVKP